ncbi:ly6/PLAUR domain-containing protein 2-like [Alligator mississippiensis]|uniref:Ly6/PLAUR domain-containing protein 2-like n=1 Tax=Alligator mississippiensis TaxID=8496 RepID=A0A151P6V6_ALLMI|nr:ly6/PLAUR domain-containing protein 2-like [Alligator mississippiensis]
MGGSSLSGLFLGSPQCCKEDPQHLNWYTVVSLKCYYCPYGRICVNTIQECSRDQDRCLATFFPHQGTKAKRCAKQYECDLLMPGPPHTCCRTDLCNR